MKSLRLIISFIVALSSIAYIMPYGHAAAETARKDEAKKTDQAEKPASKQKSEETDKDTEEEPKLSVQEHTITINGEPIKYKSTAGFMVLKDYDAKPKPDDKDKSGSGDADKKIDKKKGPKALAKMFFVAYTRENAGNSAKRPVVFAFNGGPGSSSIWLHMGALGPRRAALTDKGEALPPPYRLEDNPYSWITDADLVFIDPISTGFSRPEAGEDASKFHGYTEDIKSVGEFIRLYLTKYERWTSPKFIIGESYGTTRAAGLSDYLQHRYGIYLNGIILVSTVLNFGTIDFAPGNNTPFALFLPSYTAVAWYHRKLAPELLNKTLTEVLAEAENFAGHDYLLWLFNGDSLDAQKKKEIAERVSYYTGLPASYVAQLDCRVPDELFQTHLLMDQNRQVGRYDGRFTGIRYRPGRDNPDFDPSSEAVTGPFTATFNDYVRRELKFESDLPYETLAHLQSWNMAQNHYLNVAEDLSKAMSRNPYLKIWICCGRYDLATPYYASQYTVNQMTLDPAIRPNVRLTYYDAGHMLYIYKPALQKFHADMRNFLTDSMLPDSAAIPSTRP